MGIEHKKSSPYNSQSNGLAERGVRSLKDVLKKEKTSNPEKIKQIVFNINTHIQNKDEGSAAERFLRRHPRSNLPNSIKREIEHRELIQARHKKQQRIADQKGRVSTDTFELNDRVLLQDPESRRWVLKGKITKKREADDKTNHSFEIQLDGGGVTMRNKRFLRHEYAPSNKSVFR